MLTIKTRPIAHPGEDRGGQIGRFILHRRPHFQDRAEPRSRCAALWRMTRSRRASPCGGASQGAAPPAPRRARRRAGSENNRRWISPGRKSVPGRNRCHVRSGYALPTPLPKCTPSRETKPGRKPLNGAAKLFRQTRPALCVSICSGHSHSIVCVCHNYLK